MAGTKTEVQAFAQRWQGRGYEKGESVKFWIELQQAIGYQHVHTTLYEHHLDSGGFADVWLRDGNTIVEQKSLGVDLDKPELRQGAMKTPLDQALDYVDDLPRIEQPRFVVTCNFETFRVYDRDAWSKTLLPLHAFEFTLSELADHPEYLGFIVDPKNARLEKEKEVSIRAGALIGRLYDRLERKYIDPESPQSKHALNVLCVRMVFCLFCEDSGLFENNAFYDYLKDVPPAYMRQALRKLFRALDTPKAEPVEADTDTFTEEADADTFAEEADVDTFAEEADDDAFAETEDVDTLADEADADADAFAEEEPVSYVEEDEEVALEAEADDEDYEEADDEDYDESDAYDASKLPPELGGEEDDDEEDGPYTITKVNTFLAILYFIIPGLVIGLPVFLALLVLNVAFLAVSAAVLTAAVLLVLTGLTPLTLADRLLCFGSAAAALAVGLVLLWFTIWFFVCVTCGWVRLMTRGGKRLSRKEVEIE